MKISELLAEKLVDTMGIEDDLTNEFFKFIKPELGNRDFGEMVLSDLQRGQTETFRNFATPEIRKKLESIVKKDLTGLYIIIQPKLMNIAHTPMVKSMFGQAIDKKAMNRKFRKSTGGSLFTGFDVSVVRGLSQKEIRDNLNKERNPLSIKLLEIVLNNEHLFLIHFNIPDYVTYKDLIREKDFLRIGLSHEVSHLIHILYNIDYATRFDKKIRPKDLKSKDEYGGEKDPKKQFEIYHNKPTEVRAWGRTIAEQMLRWARKINRVTNKPNFKENITINNFQEVMEKTFGYKQVSQSVSDDNKKLIIKNVYDKIFNQPEE